MLGLEKRSLWKPDHEVYRVADKLALQLPLENQLD